MRFDRAWNAACSHVFKVDQQLLPQANSLIFPWQILVRSDQDPARIRPFFLRKRLNPERSVQPRNCRILSGFGLGLSRILVSLPLLLNQGKARKWLNPERSVQPRNCRILSGFRIGCYQDLGQFSTKFKIRNLSRNS